MFYINIMDIDEKIIQNTKCKKQFACLNNKNHKCCVVKSCIDKQLCFIDCAGKIYCNYQMSFGNSEICNCPVRGVIYNKYKK
jgi:hypothetical protein